MKMNINYHFWNLVVIVDSHNNILLLERNKGDFDGYVPPGGKVEFPETFEESAKREVYEETGLKLDQLELVSISGYINEQKLEQFVYLDYFSNDFSGELMEAGIEGRCLWHPIDRLDEILIHPDIKVRIRHILAKDSFEYQIYWDERKNKPSERRLTVYQRQ
ncbi:8-oxo-dGTP diphosphatase [Oceanobacillus kimchii]|uniref:8-oxo-dGTP diphosphatase n=1 Tax=Oceanobacillus kimchii TaxID=746691 RepID=UPI00098459D9|nr:8-oxo-dGTP diphosphatase [Oceanobacillus kimchii]